jgi:hypothetical protein
MQTPENLLLDVGVISEEEDGEEEPIMWLTRTYRSRNWLRQISWLTRTGVNGKRQPLVGRLCLILKGDAEKDLGRMCVVSRQTKCMVSVIWKDETSGRMQKLKHPESLIQLEDGLRVVQDADRMLWIVWNREAEESV